MVVPKQTNERLFCWEQIMRTNPLFRISQVFAPGRNAGHLLPLYALFSALEQLCAQSPEEEVRRRKLEWWRNECIVRDPAGSDHPILKELTRSAVGTRLDRRLLAQLFDSAEARLDRFSPVDAGELEALCRLTGQPQCELELHLASAAREAQVPEAATHIGLAQLVRESAGQGGTNRFWWVPLNLLARHGITRAELEQNAHHTAAQAIFRDIIEEWRTWRTAGNGAKKAPVPDPSASRHLAVHAHLQRRALMRLEHLQPDQYSSAFRKLGPRELLAAWQAARRISRR